MKLPALVLCLFLPYLAEAAVPRVLIIGDDIYNQPVQSVSKELAGRAQVVHSNAPVGEVLHTGISEKSLDALLKDGKWDLIHFNFGLGDLIHRVPRLSSMRVLPIHAGGVRMTSPEKYEANLRAIVAKLKKTGAKLVWASTTPIRHSASNVFAMGSEIQYNAIATKVMTENRIPTNDMYSYVKGLINMDRPAGHGFDPFEFDKKPIHPQIVATVVKQLSIK